MLITFNASIAKEVGVNKAVLVHIIHEHDSITRRKIKEMLPFVNDFTLPKSLLDLEHKGYITSYQEKGFDKTNYYSCTDKANNIYKED